MPRKLTNASHPEGAAMGRPDTITCPNLPVLFHLVKLRWVGGDYDQGGAYWGNSGESDIYHAWGNTRRQACDVEQEMFVRALSRHEAKHHVLARFPLANFYDGGTTPKKGRGNA